MAHGLCMTHYVRARRRAKAKGSPAPGRRIRELDAPIREYDVGYEITPAIRLPKEIPEAMARIAKKDGVGPYDVARTILETIHRDFAHRVNNQLLGALNPERFTPNRRTGFARMAPTRVKPEVTKWVEKVAKENDWTLYLTYQLLFKAWYDRWYA